MTTAARTRGRAPAATVSPILLAGLLAVPAVLTAQTPDAPATAAAPAIVDGEARIVEAFKDPDSWVRHDLWVEAPFDSDGDGQLDRLHVSVTRQQQTETEGLKVPVVYETSPYFSGTGTIDKRFFWDPRQVLGGEPPARTPMPPIAFRPRRPVISNSLVRTWVPRGFAVVHSASPGTGLSTGCPTVGGENESLAPKAVIDWLNGRAPGYTSVGGDETVEATWCTGKVGMIGTSYNGTLPLAAATTGVDGLAAIVPIAPNTSYYHYYRSNGLVRHPGGYMGEDIDVLYDFINSGRPERREWCNRHVREATLLAGLDRVTGDYNDFWAGRDYVEQLDGVKAAVLMAHAFNDWNVMPEHSVRVYLGLRARGVPCRAYFHQGGHGGPPPLQMINRWFTRYLHGVENGVEDEPRGWIVREGDRRQDPTPYADYPNPDAAPVVLRPQGGGREVGQLAAAAAAPAVETLIDDVSVGGADLAQAEASEHRLLYATPELAAPLHVSGIAKLRIRLAANRPAANLSVWLVSLPWTSGRRAPPTDNIITRGWADPQNHASLTDSEPLEPGRFYDLAFDLQPDDQVIPAGARIGLMVFSSDRDFTLWPPPGTELSVDLAHTELELPVVGGSAALRAALPGEQR